MTIYEQAVAYINYCEKNGYTCDIQYNVMLERFMVFTAGGTRIDYFDSAQDLYMWLSQRYDDEKEAGNI